MAKRYGMVLDVDRCIGCHTCNVACKMYYGSRPEVNYNQVERVEWGEYPDAKQRFKLTMCMHCEDAPCVAACPVGATYTSDEGIVLIDYETCIGCGACVTACPYNQRNLVKDDITNFDGVIAPFEEEAASRLNIVEKCILCYGRVQAGEQPICTIHCPGQCRIFGDVNDSESDISKYIKENNAINVKGTSIYYVIPEGMDRSLLPPDLTVAATIANVEGTKEGESEGISPVTIAAGIVGAAALAGGGYAYKKGKDKSIDKKGGNE